VTCRRTDFLTTPINGIQIFILQQFRMDEVRAYFRSASKHVFKYSAKEINTREGPFLKQAVEHASEFVKNPLLLALIVWIYNAGQRIPDNRIELYHQCSELLFKRWDTLKDIDRDLPDAHWLFQLLTEIAHSLYLINRAEEGDSNSEWLKARALEFFRRVYEGDVENRACASSERFVRHLIGR
jgi:predicted NACHT family NTPase